MTGCEPFVIDIARHSDEAAGILAAERSVGSAQTGASRLIRSKRNQGKRQERPLEMARVTRWTEREGPDESELRWWFKAEGLEPYRWSNGPGATYAEHRHSYVKVLCVVQGGISFTLPQHERVIELEPGDRLELPAQINHTALVGSDGVVCLEAPRS